MLNVGYRSVSQERRRLRDRLSDNRDAQDLFKGFLENVTIEESTPWSMIASFAERQKILTVRPSSPKIILEKEV